MRRLIMSVASLLVSAVILSSCTGSGRVDTRRDGDNIRGFIFMG